MSKSYKIQYLKSNVKNLFGTIGTIDIKCWESWQYKLYNRTCTYNSYTSKIVLPTRVSFSMLISIRVNSIQSENSIQPNFSMTS